MKLTDTTQISLLLTGHLARLAGWSAVCVVVALAVLAIRRPVGPPFGFWGMTAAWCAVNLAIALPGLIRPSAPDLRPLREFLTFNLGLNLGYMAVGIALMAMGKQRARGAGLAVLIQGGLLLLLDGYLWSALPTR